MDNELKIEYGDSMMYGGDPDKIDFGGLTPNNNPLDVNYPRPTASEGLSAPDADYGSQPFYRGNKDVALERGTGSLTIKPRLGDETTVHMAGGGFASTADADAAERALRGTNRDARNPLPMTMSRGDYLQTGVDPAMARVENMAKRAGK